MKRICEPFGIWVASLAVKVFLTTFLPPSLFVEFSFLFCHIFLTLSTAVGTAYVQLRVENDEFSAVYGLGYTIMRFIITIMACMCLYYLTLWSIGTLYAALTFIHSVSRVLRVAALRQNQKQKKEITK